MANLLLRNVPDATLAALKQRARQNRRSLQQELLRIVEDAAVEQPTKAPAELAAAIRARLAQNGREFGDSVLDLRQDRER